MIDGQALFDAALVLAKSQAASSEDGKGVAAAALTDTGETLTGIWIDAMVDAACLCAETGPICDAHRSGQRIVASICVMWSAANDATVLAACGVCQERLAVFGTETLIGVGDDSDLGFEFRTLGDLRPSPWWDSIGR